MFLHRKVVYCFISYPSIVQLQFDYPEICASQVQGQILTRLRTI